MIGFIHNKLRMNSIKTSIIIYFMGLISIIVLFISIVSYQTTIRDSESLSINYTKRLLKEVNGNIDSYIENMKNMGTVVVENNDVRELMAFYKRHKNEELTYSQRQRLSELKLRASAHMDIVAKTRSDITNIAIISKYGDVVLSDAYKKTNPNSKFNLADWYLKPMSYKNNIVVSPSHVQNLVQGEYPWVISISKAVLDPVAEDVAGVMLIDLNYRAIEEICEKVQLGKSGYIYLVDEKNKTVYHPQQQLIFSGIKKEKTKEVFADMGDEGFVRKDDKIYIRDDSPVTGWSAIGVVNTKELISNRGALVQFYIILAAVAIVFSILFAVMISTNITRPIKKLESTMHKVEEGNLEVKAEIERDDEIGHVSKTFNSMVVRLKELMDSQVSKEEEKRKSEIKALQAQINPHFLYNTLETIIWMSASGKNQEVVKVTEALAGLFRTSISRGESLVDMRVEVENIESYLTIQKMRYRDKLRYSIDIPEELLDLRIPKLILQPIVENAIYHGIKPLPEGGKVWISAKREDGSIILVVEDSGIGMSEQELRELFLPKQRGSRGIGVLNVHERIRLVFGEGYGLKYTQREVGGTRVEVLMPAVEGGEGGYEELHS